MALIEYRNDDGIAYIRLNRPEVLNALTDEMMVALKDAFFQLDDDPNAYVGILSGAGRAFCSGGDVRQRQLKPREELERLGTAQARGTHLEDLMYRFTRWKPLIAAVHGYVMGAGLYLALSCEMIVAAKGTKFQVTETSRGVDSSRFWMLLKDRASGGFATSVALTGRFWTAEEAIKSGAVDLLAAPGRHVTEATELARTIMNNPPLAVRALTEARRGVNEEIEMRSRLSRRKDLHLTEDFREGAMAFVEKRKPMFRGR